MLLQCFDLSISESKHSFCLFTKQRISSDSCCRNFSVTDVQSRLNLYVTLFTFLTRNTANVGNLIQLHIFFMFHVTISHMKTFENHITDTKISVLLSNLSLLIMFSVDRHCLSIQVLLAFQERKKERKKEREKERERGG